MTLIVSCSAVLLGLLMAAGAALAPSVCACVWRELTGLPCAGCGGTRAAIFILQGDFLSALRLNPGAAVAVAALLVTNVYAVVVLLLRLEPWRPRIPRWRWFFGAGLLANWVYLLFVSQP